MNELHTTKKKIEYMKGLLQIEAVEIADINKISITVYDWNEVDVPLIKSKVIGGTLDTIDVIKEIEDILKEIEIEKGGKN
ncbi:MAG: hypothetical protein K1W35_04185 [Lachnospiraceae bacterium]